MCKACNTSPMVTRQWAIRSDCLKDIKTACREGQKDTPKWLAKPRSTKAELSYQLRRLAGNAVHETECEASNV